MKHRELFGSEARKAIQRCIVLTLIATLGTGQSHAQSGDGGAPQERSPAVVKEITPQELSNMLGKGVFIYDCNEADNYDWAHVPGAILTVYDALSADHLPADLGAMLVFYCYSPECPAGTTAAHTAAKLGYTNVYSMVAGITGWQDAGLKTEP